MQEFEAVFLDIDTDEIQSKLNKIEAKKVGEYFYRRYVFDYPDFRLNEEGAWLRLIDEGDKVRLGFKKRLGATSHDGSTSDTGMEEVEVEVSDFERTAILIRKLGFIDKFYQENKRIRWVKGEVEFDIDTWPRLNPYLEIESKNWDMVDKAITQLGLDPKDKKIFSNFQIYKLKGIDLMEYSHITFDGLTKRE
jgi:adenylate cyclase class 2